MCVLACCGVSAAKDGLLSQECPVLQDVMQWETEFQQLHQMLGDIKRHVKEYELAHGPPPG